MQSWKLTWRRTGIAMKRQWVESQVVEAEPAFTGCCNRAAEAPTKAQGKEH